MVQCDSYSIEWIGHLVCGTLKCLLRPPDTRRHDLVNELGSAQIDMEDGWTECTRFVGTQVCVLLTISIITRRFLFFVYGFSKRGLCMASDQNRINYFLHESGRHT